MMNKYISFIVPVYNVEAYLQQCLDSLLDQDISSELYEIILVDDGSTDSSGRICDQYSANYENINCFHKINGGLSDARNYGMKIAIGKYILFLDSDDYIRKDILGTIIKQCKEQGEPDIFFLQAQKVFPNGELKNCDKEMDMNALNANRETVIRYLANRDMYPASACFKMVERKLLIDNGIRFKKGQLSEDYEWSLMVFLKASTYGCCNENYYFYRQGRKDSITNSVSERHILDLFKIIEKMESIAQEKEYIDLSDDILKFAAYIYRCLLWNISPYYKKYLNELEHMKYLLDKKESKDIRIIRNVSRIVGLENTARLLSIYKKFRLK